MKILLADNFSISSHPFSCGQTRFDLKDRFLLILLVRVRHHNSLRQRHRDFSLHPRPAASPPQLIDITLLFLGRWMAFYIAIMKCQTPGTRNERKGTEHFQEGEVVEHRSSKVETVAPFSKEKTPNRVEWRVVQRACLPITSAAGENILFPSNLQLFFN